MSSDASYTRCDMGLFDFFRRSSSRSRSKTTSETVTTAASTTTNTTTNTTNTTTQQALHAFNSASTVSLQSTNSSSFEGAPIPVKVSSTYSERASMPEMPRKLLSQQSASTMSSISNNSELGDEDYNERPSESLGSINNYEVIRELGRGATAIVQLGKHKDTDRLVALKVFKTSLLKKMREVKRVGRRMVVSTALDKVQVEIAIMKKFRHHNLLNLLEVFDDDTETLVLMLEYAPYGQIMEWDAAERVYRANPKAVADNNSSVFDEDSLRRCIRQLLLGLEYLHNNHICHRDLKPENILLGEDGIYKIADFGVAHLFEDDKKDESSNQQPGADIGSGKKKGIVASTAGTYAFMAPETLKGKEYSAYDADVWALGITVYALSFGKIPYYHTDVVELFEMIENHPLDLSEDSNNASISEGLSSLLRGMLEKDPERRWGIKQCKEHSWLHHDLDDTAKDAFVHTTLEQVTVSEEEVEKAVTKVTSMNVLMRVQLGANKWKRKAMASLETKKRASLSTQPSIEEENNNDRMSVGSTSERPSLVLKACTEEQQAEGNQLEV